MNISEFDYELPAELIAQYPLPERDASRLLYLSRENGVMQDSQVNHLVDFLRAGDLLIFNNTRVIPARLYGRKASGGKVEILVERIQPDNHLLTQLKASKSPSVGSQIIFNENVHATVVGRQDEFFILAFPHDIDVLNVLEEHGHIPLPPYIKRPDDVSDWERYQTIFAEQLGAVAAPTAGLHFNDDLMATLTQKGIDHTFITLHVGAGTFQPIRVENILEHKMHSELISIDDDVCEKIKSVKQQGGRIIAVGTTVVRVLESIAQTNGLQAYCGETDIFIYPGFEFKVIDGLMTNFHLPRSSLLMLVSAFAGRESILSAYNKAIAKQYRFFSYGDAMLIL